MYFHIIIVFYKMDVNHLIVYTPLNMTGNIVVSPWGPDIPVKPIAIAARKAERVG